MVVKAAQDLSLVLQKKSNNKGDERLRSLKELSDIFMEMAQTEKPDSWETPTKALTDEPTNSEAKQTAKPAALPIMQGGAAAPRVLRPVTPIVPRLPKGVYPVVHKWQPKWYTDWTTTSKRKPS